MPIVLALVGALLGLILHGTASPVFMVLGGGAAGYVLAEMLTQRARWAELEREVREIKERLAALRRAQPEAPVVAERAAAAPPMEPSAIDTVGVSVQAAAAPVLTGTMGTTAQARTPSPSLAVEAPPRTRAFAEPKPASAAPDHESVILAAVRSYFTGGNTLVRVGILILFFGVAFLLRYAAEHSHVPIQLRVSGVACGGVALLVLGLRLRARRVGYALALQGGGVGILYLTAFAALRLYSLMPAAVAFAVAVVLAAFTALLAVLQSSQAFAFLAVTGGFLAPILASTGEGSHVVLFTYYAVLNAIILVIAWYKAWRALNLAGFAFTFLISAAWGALHYNSELFASTEPFLVLFFLFYVAIAVLFSMRQPPNLRGYVDGTLVFGTPMAAFGYQSGMLHERPHLLAFSAVVIGAFYLLVAWLLLRQRRDAQRLLIEAFIALAVVFFTVATPLALDSTATGVTWALEGAALIWIGARQSRVVPRVFGVLLQVAVAAVQFSGIDQFFVQEAPAAGLYLARAVTAVAAILSAVVLSQHASRLRSYEEPVAAGALLLGLLEWWVCGLLEIDRYAPVGYVRSLSLLFVTLTALGCSELSRRAPLPMAKWPALALLPAMLAVALLSLWPPLRHPFDGGGWLIWPLAFAALYSIGRRHEGPPDEPLASWLHILSAWLLVALSTWQLAWAIDRGVSGRGSWPAVGWMLVPVIALLLLPRLRRRFEWPFRVHEAAYTAFAGGGVALYLAVWVVATNTSIPGDPYPFPYVPLLNVLDLAEGLALLVLVWFWRAIRARGDARVTLDPNGKVVGAVLAALVFLWLNAALIRTLHRWADVPFDFDAIVDSTLVQTSLSIFWTLLALAAMLIATRHVSRPLWITGACLLAAAIVKLFVVDLSRVGTVERIVSFVGVGLLTLVIGYFSPLPPAATSRRTIA